MKKKFEMFWKDYCDLYAISWGFLKKHWIGTIIYVVVLFTAYVIWICYSVFGGLDVIVDWFKNTFGAIKRFFKRKVHKA
uniref:Uncharacterized protein n=1 Tax=Siphoviridae sp. cthu813 TaxID=2825618 RepID=A0A8S5VIH0_9CAUD|nr:MAG TPA: hypothetical protein [Siphoviridae sp. cthu813]